MGQDQKEQEGGEGEARLYGKQIDQGDMKADFDGVILRADNLDEKRGLSVKKGDVLMELGQPGSLQAELSVSDRDIQEIHEKTQHGKLRTSSEPGQEFGFTIDRVVPSGDAKEGDNVFKVYVTLDEKAPWMRPGMMASADVDTDHRRLVWIWTHRLIDFVRLKLWM